ncbi:MAG TPA: hypothetical protein VJN01_05895, partial [Xanthomonadales bacterium]|nr:hypothetical protein [Xanthomonadales bacterium]
MTSVVPFKQRSRFFSDFLVAIGLLSLPICSSAADSISALGRLEPQQGVRLVSAPLTPESI